jgi:hypothetical protein
MRFAAPLLLAMLTVSSALSETDRDGISELFDPVAIARNGCGDRGEIRGESLALIADTPQATKPPFFKGLGTLSYRITTKKPEAQAYFDQGLRLMYAFKKL